MVILRAQLRTPVTDASLLRLKDSNLLSLNDPKMMSSTAFATDSIVQTEGGVGMWVSC